MKRLVDLHSKPGLRTKFERLRNARPLLNRAFIDQTRLETGLLFDEHYFRRSIADLEARPDSLFASDLEYEMEHRFRFPIEQTGTLLTRFETRGSAAAERFALYLGPLVGVLLGAGLTLLLHDSQPGGPRIM